MTEKKISSSWTKPILILLTLAWIIMPAILIRTTGGEIKIEGTQIFAVLFFAAFVGVTLYLTFSLADVRVRDEEILFKKVFGKEKKYSFDKIGYPKTFQYKKLKFTSVKMEGVNREKNTFLILNNKALLSGEQIDAEDILLSLIKTKKTDNND